MAKEASFCHVFLSFRGETRNKFTCFLYEALKAEGFVAFMDKSDIRVGDEVDLTIKEGIRNSMSAIIIFSQNYASSTWCLDELVLILERKKNSRYFIIPIFYEVEIRDIKHQLGHYGLALERHRVRHNDKVEKWREALVEVGNILGDHVEGLQSTFIQKIVKLFREKMAAKFPECRLPTRKSSVLQGSSSTSVSNDKVILYTVSVNNGLGTNGLAKNVLMSGNVVFEERNCSKEPKYIKELEELVGSDKVRFPMVIVNGKDLCGEEEVEGLEDFENKQMLMLLLNQLHVSATAPPDSDPISALNGAVIQNGAENGDFFLKNSENEEGTGIVSPPRPGPKFPNPQFPVRSSMVPMLVKFAYIISKILR